LEQSSENTNRTKLNWFYKQLCTILKNYSEQCYRSATLVHYVLYLGDAEGSRSLAPLGELVDLVFAGGGHQAHRVLDDAGVAVPVAHVEGVRVLAHSHRRRLAVVPGK
jgi:hypothetical protein